MGMKPVSSMLERCSWCSCGALEVDDAFMIHAIYGAMYTLHETCSSASYGQKRADKVVQVAVLLGRKSVFTVRLCDVSRGSPRPSRDDDWVSREPR